MKESEITTYSNITPGDERNHYRPARFDCTDGYIGITQHYERVLLTPEQVKALIEFVAQEGGGE